MRRVPLLAVLALGPLALSLAAQAATYVVRPDGLGDFPTIQAALDGVMEGDVIELADGTFTGDGNRDLDFLGKNLTVRSQSGDPEVCTIDCQGSETEPHRGFCFNNLEGPEARIESITITNGWGPVGPTPWEAGGAVFCRMAQPALTDCIFLNNHAVWRGGAIYAGRDGGPTLTDCVFSGNSARYGGGMRCDSTSAPILTRCQFIGNSAVYNGGGFDSFNQSTPILTDCLFSDNAAPWAGGGAYNGDCAITHYTRCTFIANESPGGGGAFCCSNSMTMFQRCTFEGNRAPDGGSSIYAGCHADVTMERCILAFGLEGGSAHVTTDGEFTLSCCDIFGNAGGDWVEEILDQFGINGNFSEDPIFCNAAAGNLTLHQDSPCLPGQHPLGDECEIIGAWPIGCPLSPVIVEPSFPNGYGLTRCAPNPFRTAARITYFLPDPLPAGDAGPMELRIHDAAGRLVRILAAGDPAAGQHTVVWDGRDDAGERLPGGVYFCRMSWNRQRTLRQLHLIR